jgi:hypothetical protein
MDRIRNKIIGTKMGVKKNTLQEAKEEKLWWSSLVMRMECYRIARQVAESNPQGQMRRDREVSVWKDGIRGSTKRRNLKDDECFGRDLWMINLCLWVEENCVVTEQIVKNTSSEESCLLLPHYM